MKNETRQALEEVSAKMDQLKAEIAEYQAEWDDLREQFIALCTQAVKEDRPLEQHPDIAKFSFVNRETGKVYGRTRSQSSSYRIDKMLAHDVFKDAVREKSVYDVDEVELAKIVKQHPELLPELQDNFVEVKPPTVKLSPVREISAEDL